MTILLASLLTLSAPARADETASTDGASNSVYLEPSIEAGFLGILSHTLQQDSQGTDFDLKKDGGQGTLFPFFRLGADLNVGKRHHVDFVMQPLDLRSEVRLQDDLVVDGALFPADSAVDIRYGFDFYRGSYRYDLIGNPDTELSFGAGLQLRDADIIFTSGDGTLRRENRNVGPVPLLAGRFERRLSDRWWMAVDATGFYANIKVLNGSTTTTVEGAIYDVELQAGLDSSGPLKSWLNLRFIGGGSDGTNSNNDGPGDGYTKNWLNAMTVSLGMALDSRKL